MRARKLHVQGGGLVATALVAVARLGGTAAYMGALGDDPLADFCASELARAGVNLAHLRRVPGKSVLTAVVIAGQAAGTREIIWTDAQWPATLPAQVTEEAVRGARVLHVDNFQVPAALRAAQTARAHGIPVTVDLEPGGRPADELLKLVDYAIVPLEFARKRHGAQGMEDGAEALFAEIAPHGGRAATVTDGPLGSVTRTAAERLYQPAYKVEVVDTTGCGDVFHGAFAFGLAQGWVLERILPFAAATAALKCRAPGGRAGIPTRAEVEAFLAAEPATMDAEQ